MLPPSSTRWSLGNLPICCSGFPWLRLGYQWKHASQTSPKFSRRILAAKSSRSELRRQPGESGGLHRCHHGPNPKPSSSSSSSSSSSCTLSFTRYRRLRDARSELLGFCLRRLTCLLALQASLTMRIVNKEWSDGVVFCRGPPDALSAPSAVAPQYGKCPERLSLCVSYKMLQVDSGSALCCKARSIWMRL